MAHEHDWQRVTHIDGCHFSSTDYKCECGAVRSQYDERDFGDQFSMASVWALPQECERCAELLDGAERTSRDEILLPR